MEHAPTIGALCGGRLAKAKGVRYGPPSLVPQAVMAVEAIFLSESTSSAVGSRRSRAAVHGDFTIDQAVVSTSRVGCQAALGVEGVMTSSVETDDVNTGEPIRPDPLRVRRMWLWGPGSSPDMPASQMLVCPGRDPMR